MLGSETYNKRCFKCISEPARKLSLCLEKTQIQCEIVALYCLAKFLINILEAIQLPRSPVGCSVG